MPVVNPGIRRFLASAIQRLFNGASFSAPLTHSLVPERGTGSATFTRATTATVKDHEGVLRTVPSGCARFEGARMVRNEVLASENLTVWPVAGGATTTATEITFNGTVNGRAVNNVFTSGATYICRFRAKLVSGAGTLKILNFGAEPTVPLTSSYQDFSFVGVCGSLTMGFVDRVGTSFVVAITEMQFENITGRADQTTPSEYVSVGVASSPYYHGSMVDGVKCFATDINGAAIPLTTLLGYSAEGARTNLCLQSNAFTTTWVNGGATPVQNAVSPSGATDAWTLTSGSAAYNSIYQTITVASATTYTASVYAKKASTSVLSLEFRGSSATPDAVFNLNTGTLTSGSGVITSIGNGWYRCSITKTSVDTSEIFIIGLGNPAATNDSIYIYGAQLEAASFASSYIPTTTIAVARNADVLTYSSSGNISGTVGTVYCEASVADFSNTRRVFDLNTGGTSVPIYYQLANGFQSFHDGTAARSAGVVGTAGVVTKLGLAYGGAAGLMSKNGTNQTAQTFDGSFGTITDFSPGGGYAAGQEIFGNIKQVRIWQRALSSSELQAITR